MSRVWSQRQRSSPRAWLILLLAVAAIALISAWFDRLPGPIDGHALAVDGDTLRIGDRRVRLVDLDAPELDQTCFDAQGAEWACGAAAKSFLADILKRDAVSCARAGRDSYGRALAACRLGEEDIGAQIVSAGWAVADFGYLAEEGRAQAARRGIWAGNFVAPSEWRRRGRNDLGLGIWEWIRSWFQ